MCMMSVWVCIPWHRCGNLKTALQPALLPLCGFWESNSSCQACVPSAFNPLNHLDGLNPTFWGKVCWPGWFETHYVTQVGLQLAEIMLSLTSQVHYRFDPPYHLIWAFERFKVERFSSFDTTVFMSFFLQNWHSFILKYFRCIFASAVTFVITRNKSCNIP